jgi:hypothetical protein
MYRGYRPRPEAPDDVADAFLFRRLTLVVTAFN